jgi:hypothetical protein
VSENVIYFLPKNTNIVPLYSLLECNWEVSYIIYMYAE